jgi:fucose permease
MLLDCASEWSIVFWTPEFLSTVHHLPKADAAANVTAFFIAMIGSRVLGTQLSRHFPIRLLLPAALATGLSGFLIFWLAPWPVLSVAGLFLAGLGTANMYPLTLSAALGVEPQLSGVAASRMNIATGASGLFGPLVLGCLADRIGLRSAYSVVALLLLMAIAMAFAALRALQARAQAAISVAPSA